MVALGFGWMRGGAREKRKKPLTVPIGLFGRQHLQHVYAPPAVRSLQDDLGIHADLCTDAVCTRISGRARASTVMIVPAIDERLVIGGESSVTTTPRG